MASRLTSSGRSHLPSKGDHPHQPAGQGVRRVIEHGGGQMLDPLGGHPVLFAPEGQPDVRLGVLTRLLPGSLVGGQVRGGFRGRLRRVIRDQPDADQDDG